MPDMTIEDWGNCRAHHATARVGIRDTDGRLAERGDVGEVCAVDTIDGYVVVDFPTTGPMLCTPEEVRPA